MPKLRTPEKQELNSLVEHLQYYPITGELRWKTASKGRQKGAIAGTVGRGYFWIGFRNKKYAGHRICWFLHYGIWPNKEIDHIDGDGCNNKPHNMRLASRQLNAQNIRKPCKNNKSGFLGVRQRAPTQKYQASITTNKKSAFIGSFATPEEAHQAYLDEKRKQHIGNTL